MTPQGCSPVGKLLLVALIMTGAACGNPELTCSAQVKKTEVPYTVSGDTMRLGGERANFDLIRVGPAGAVPVLGTWHWSPVLEHEPLEAERIVRLTNIMIFADSFRIDEECIHYSDGRTARASASSPATISDTTIKILEDRSQVVRF